ncbi:DUF4238 domain-containing protein [Methylobacterium sp. Gmos1]
MPQQKIAWRHHYLPEFYLKRWTSNGKLVEFSRQYKDVVKPRYCSPRATGFVNAKEFLADLPLIEKAFYEEKFFSPVDSKAADVLTKMESNAQKFTAEERTAWAQFVMTLVFRHPSYIQNLRARLHENMLVITPESEKDWRKRRQKNDPLRLVDKIRQELAQNSEELSRHSLELANAMMASQRIGTHLVNMIWGQSPMHPLAPALFTSDRPVYWHGALEEDDCHIMMPVSPKRVFWAVNKSAMSDIIRRVHNQDMVRFMNEQVTRRSLKYVYAMGDRELPYLQEFMGVNPEETVIDLFLKPRSYKEHLQAKIEVQRGRRRIRPMLKNGKPR